VGTSWFYLPPYAGLILREHIKTFKKYLKREYKKFDFFKQSITLELTYFQENQGVMKKALSFRIGDLI